MTALRTYSFATGILFEKVETIWVKEVARGIRGNFKICKSQFLAGWKSICAVGFMMAEFSYNKAEVKDGEA